MKKAFILLAIIFVVAAFSYAENQRPFRFELSLGGGLDVPTGEFGEKYESGMNFGALIGYYFHRNIGIVLNSQFDSFKYDIGTLDADVYKHEGGDYKAYSIFFGLKGVLPTKIKLTFYALGGVGFCMQKTSDFEIWGQGPGYSYWQMTYNKFREGNFSAMTAAAGAEYGLSNSLALFVEFRIVDVFTEQKEPPENWEWLSPSEYQDPPNVVFFPIRLGVRLKI